MWFSELRAPPIVKNDDRDGRGILRLTPSRLDVPSISTSRVPTDLRGCRRVGLPGISPGPPELSGWQGEPSIHTSQLST